MKTIEIIVEKKTDGYHAYLADFRGFWEKGKSAAEALGKLIITLSKKLKIEIEFK
jgi:predicted RNase H-like HicB family nuclease